MKPLRISGRGLPTVRARQRGMALTIALIVLVVVSILGIVAMRTALFQNRVSINSQLGAISFQAAESGIAAVASMPKVDRENLFMEAALDPDVPRRLCVTAAAEPVIDTAHGVRDAGEDADTTTDDTLTFDEPCDQFPDSVAQVTTVISQSPHIPPIPAEYELGGYEWTAVQVRAEGGVPGTRVTSVSVEEWTKLSPPSGGMDPSGGFMN